MYLLGLAAAVAAAAGRWLPGAGWVYRAPRHGLAAWYVVLAVIVVSAGIAAGSIAVHWPTAWDSVCNWWSWCVDALAGGHGTAARLAGWAAVAALAALGLRSGLAVARNLRATRRRMREQVALLRLVGRYDAHLRAMVVDDPRPVAYLLPGRGGAVVVTTGAVGGLPPGQLAAVLAHERAHAAGRHHLLVQGVRLLVAALPAVALFARAAAQIDRLVEILADEVAAGGHGRVELARALVACAEAAAAPAADARQAIPAGAVAATGGDALERVQRLLLPPPRLPRAGQLAVTAALAGLVAAPLLVIGLVVAVPALAACLPVA
jgi:Zn-dependent protease with chaperone function